MIKLYCGQNKKGVWKASTDISKISKFNNIFTSEVETIHNDKVYMIKTYYGFDYNYGSTINPISDVIEYDFNLYHSVGAAKKSKLWSDRERLATEKPEDFHVTPFSIATDDGGSAFIYGDAMGGNYNMSIFSVRVL